MFPLGLWSNLLRFFDAANTEAENKKELKEAIEFAKDYDFEIIVEQGINGKEVECAVLEEDGEVKASCVGQILSAE